jgi:hypothetical protein
MLENDEYNMQEHTQWSDEKFWQTIKAEEFDQHKLNQECNKLRNSSKYIATRFEQKKVTLVLKLDMLLENPFLTIIAGIRRRIGTRPNEDSP